MNEYRRLWTCFCCTIAFLAVSGWAQQPIHEHPNERLAQRLAGSAVTILQIKPLSPHALETAAGVLAAAMDLAPDNIELWHLTLDVADLAEDTQLQSRAIRAIVRLDPADDVVRLRRLLEVVETAQTAEQRVAVFERLLAPERIDALGAPVASRLTLDYALLLRREGRVSAFGEQLARAVTLDPSNRAAAALAAGFFQSNVNDPYGETELLVNLFLADPTTIDVQAAIGQLALGSGAYDAAARMFQIMSESYLVLRQLPPTDTSADHVIALWGADRVEDALALIDQRQHIFNAAAQSEALRGDKQKTPVDVADVTGLMTPTLAAVRAAMLERLRDPHAAESLELALQSYGKVIEQAQAADTPLPPESIAAGYLEMAWLAAWLGRDSNRPATYIQQADALAPISESAKARFDGWMALRRGDLALASDRFAATDPDDHAAIIGKAMLLLERDQQSADAARLLLRVAREKTGTVMGVWSADLLFKTIGRRAPISTLAQRINALIDSIPAYVDRFPSNPGELYSVRIHAIRSRISPGDPIIVNVEIANNSRIPLAIDPSGPIDPQIALLPSVRIAQQSKLPPIDPILINIDRRLRLEPKQRVIIPIDLRRYTVGTLQENFLLIGSFVRIRAVWNFQMTVGRTFEPSLLGGETDTLNFRIDGVRLSLGWIEQAMRDIEVVDQPDDLDTLIMLTHLPNHQVPDVTPEAVAELASQLPDLLAESFSRVDPIQQAMVLTEMSPSPVTTKLLAAARSSEHQIVQVAYLLSVVQQANDPMLAAGLRSEDPLVRMVAEQLSTLAGAVPSAGAATPGGSTGP